MPAPNPPRAGKPLVVQTETLDAECAAWLAERCELVRCADSETRFADLLSRAEGLVIRTYTRVDEAFLARAPRLRVVGRAGVGLDNIDIPACRARGVAVVHTPDANTRAVVELVLALMLDALRPRLFLEGALSLREWKATRDELIAPAQLADLTLGIYGMGRIGSSVARVASALGMTIVYHDLLDIPPERRSGARPVSREELLRESDILTVHVDERPSNRGLLGAEAFSMCKTGVVFINAARGFIVDARALAQFLVANPGAQALLDVHEPEPFPPDYPLLGLRNAWLSPHIAAATATAHRNMSWVVRDVWRVLSGEAPEFPARIPGEATRGAPA